MFFSRTTDKLFQFAIVIGTVAAAMYIVQHFPTVTIPSLIH